MIDLELGMLRFRNHVLDIPGLLDLAPVDRFAWQNQDFTPPTDPDLVWVEESFQTVAERTVASGAHRSFGFARYAVHYPQGKGTEEPRALLQLLANAFRPPVNLTATDGTIYVVDRAERGTPSEREEKWWVVPVTASWRADFYYPL